MRVVLFGSGSPVSLAALDALAGVSSVVAVVVPAADPIRGPRSAVRALGRRRGTRGLVSAARRRAIPVLRHHAGHARQLADALRRVEPDLACVATFPHLLDAATLGVPPRGTLGVHPSLLPRHRGPAPSFWTYLQDDAEAGVTVHWLDAGEDTGDVVLQERFPLERGRPGAELHAEIARRGAALLARAVAEVEAGRAPRVPQDAARATREPMPDPDDTHIDFTAWGAERVWHFLRGVGNAERLRDARGRAVLHGGVRGYRLEPQAGRPGQMHRVRGGWILPCRDGVVELEEASLTTRAWGRVWRLAALAGGTGGADRNA
jgi:methionyl-tRNA formyltransferase